MSLQEAEILGLEIPEEWSIFMENVFISRL